MHPIENILQTTMNELKQMIDVNTIVGNPFVAPDGATIIPISKVSFGFVSGGGEYNEQKEGTPHPLAGGAATGVSISPVAFMVERRDEIKLLTVNKRDALDKVLENIPAVVREVKEVINEVSVNEGEQDEAQEV